MADAGVRAGPLIYGKGPPWGSQRDSVSTRHLFRATTTPVAARLAAGVLVLALATMSACKLSELIDPTGPGTPQLFIGDGDNQVDTVGATLPRPLVVVVRDGLGTPAAGVTISWTVTDGGGAVQPATSITDAAGTAAASWTLGTATTPTDSTQTVRASGVGTPVNFIATTRPGAVSASQSLVTAAPATITASTGTSAATVTVTARDGFGNPIRGVPVALAAAGATITQPSAPTGPDGVATGSVSAVVAGSRSVSATLGGVTATRTAAITVRPAAVSAARSSIAVAPSLIPAGGAGATVTVTARDAFGNVVPGAAVVLSSSGALNTVVQPGAPTDTTGSTSGAVSSTRAESKLVSATADGVGLSTPAALTVAPGPAAAATSLVAVAAGSVAAGDTVTVALQAMDAFGNRILTGGLTTVSFSHAGGTSTGTFSAVRDHGTGTYSAAFSGVAAGTATAIRGAIAGVQAPGAPTVVVTPGPASRLAFVQQPTSTPTGANITPAVTVAVLDAQGNRVTGYLGSVSITIGTDPVGGAVLAGGGAAAVSGGLATFGALTIDRPGTGFRLAASSGALTGATSVLFDIQ